MRLFAAVELPAEARREIEDRVAHERGRLPAASWVRAENLHLTLAFFGEVAESALRELTASLAAATAPLAPIAARLAGAGGFPPRGPVRVVWLGVEPVESLARLAQAIREAAARAGAPADDKPFQSHVTLARCRRPWPPAARERLPALAPSEPIALEIGAAALIASELAPGGSRYTRLAALGLGGAA